MTSKSEGPVHVSAAPNAVRHLDCEDCNVIVMTDAGKPVFSRYGSEQHISRICGLIQALRTSLLDPFLGFGEIQSLRSSSLLLVFTTIGSITLVAVSRVGKYGMTETEAYLRLQLEYIYSQIIFVLTEQIQSALQQDPGIDLRESLGSIDGILLDFLDETGPRGNVGSFLANGVQSVFPISSHLREHASLVLSAVRDSTEDVVFAMLLAGNKLLSLVQPSHRANQLRNADLHLLIKNVNHQPGLSTSELWFPVCLPRFHSSAFLFCYSSRFDADTKLTLVLVSQLNTTEQFQIFRNAAVDVRRSLGLPAAPTSVLRISPEAEQNEGDISWERSGHEDVNNVVDVDDSSYVDAALEIESPMANDSTCTLLQQLQAATNGETNAVLLQSYCEIAQALHFLFRLDVPVDTHNHRKKSAGSLTQCISPPLGFPFTDAAAKRRLWSTYQKLQLRLRLGSATADATTKGCEKFDQDENNGGPNRYPVTSLGEQPPDVQGITYVLDGPELFFAMNGKGFEIYMAVPSSIPIKQAATLGAKLVRALLQDEKKLFLWSPITWKD